MGALFGFAFLLGFSRFLKDFFGSFRW